MSRTRTRSFDLDSEPDWLVQVRIIIHDMERVPENAAYIYFYWVEKKQEWDWQFITAAGLATVFRSMLADLKLQDVSRSAIWDINEARIMYYSKYIS